MLVEQRATQETEKNESYAKPKVDKYMEFYNGIWEGKSVLKSSTVL